MVQAPQPISLVERHADRVEADRARGRSRVARRQPSGGEPAQAAALGTRETGERSMQLILGRPRAPSSPRLDLDEDERAVGEGDEVDLAVARADVAREDREAEALQVGGGEVLAEPAETPARVLARAAGGSCRA